MAVGRPPGGPPLSSGCFPSGTRTAKTFTLVRTPTRPGPTGRILAAGRDFESAPPLTTQEAPLPKPSRQLPAPPSTPAQRLPAWAWLGASVCALLAAAAAGALVYQHFSGDPLPGCGPKSACATIEAHPFGRIDFPARLASATGLPKWPVSFLGVAYFLSAAIALFACHARASRALLWVVRAGALASLFYLVVILTDQKFCKYCIAAHAMNFATLAFLEIGMRTPRHAPPPALPLKPLPARAPRTTLVLLAGVFALASASLALAERSKVAAHAARTELTLADDQKALAAKAERDRTAAAQTPATPANPFGPSGFTGRWRLGPEAAPVRIVVFSSYQCESCRRIELEVLALIDKHPGKISLVAKHFPLCTDCNKYVVGSSPHPNSCWGARAAETAGLLKGQDGFWQMHKWLFDRAGAFTDTELVAGLKQLGYDDKTFTTIMTSDAPLRTVQDDIEQANLLGLNQTPMVFINGVEFRAWEPLQALTRSVESLLAQNPAPLTAAADKPPLANDKLVADWRAESAVSIPTPVEGRFLGAADAPVRIDIFGDYTNSNTVEADAAVRSWIASRPIRYTFHHFPGNPACNPSLTKVFFENGCKPAKAIEAAFLVASPAIAQVYHTWLMANSANLGNDQVLIAGATAVGMEPETFDAAFNGPAAADAVAAAGKVAQSIKVDRIPAIYVNGKAVKVWQRDKDSILDLVVQEATPKN